jgi:hypothetical protein
MPKQHGSLGVLRRSLLVRHQQDGPAITVKLGKQL